MSGQHTKGPWVRVANPPLGDGARADTIYGANGGDYVADVYFKYMLSTRDQATFDANACLIAAAPDLLEALQTVPGDSAHITEWDAWREIARSAVLKAEGKQ